MPYNTRRKSLSLPSLGIQLPHGSRAIALRSPPNKATNDQPPPKKIKRSHTSALSSPVHSPLKTSQVTKNERSKVPVRAHEHTPPPSPGAPGEKTIDTEGINDEIVTGVIKQLEETGNRPHLLKELAAVLSNSSSAVESSANPSAIISSRLTAYIRRPWTALSPCPLGKTLIAAHPRRTYFYLTNTPHQSVPEGPESVVLSPHSKNRVISPALSSNSAEDDDIDARARAALSPSPEVDLSSHGLENEDEENPPTPAGSFSGRSSLSRDGTNAQSPLSIVPNHRAASPPLEGDEKEFTQTASSIQKRTMSQENSVDDNVIMSTELDEEQTSQAANGEETEEHAELRNSEAAATLFGHSHATTNAIEFSSPLVRPNSQHRTSSLPAKKTINEMDMDIDVRVDNVPILGENIFRAWGSDMRSPEDIELDELEDLFGEF
ncbi:MAG: hypothetical protein M1836_007317 [Candelina mexicana]|nr:MAG: hypothetical protein M1836_007317 [Candelina mexicana]